MNFASQAVVAVVGIQAIAVGMAVLLARRDRLLRANLDYLVSLAVGVLVATALFHIMPEAVEQVGNRSVVWLLFGGTILALFYVERIFAALTGHAVESNVRRDLAADDCVEAHHHHGVPPARPLNLVFGGMLHSFVDGAGVATAFAADMRIGWITAFAITLHEIPHRLGDFALLVHLQVSPRKALQLIALVGLPALAGVLLVIVAGHTLHATQWLLPISAGSFLYIALVNLMPELHAAARLGSVLLQLACMTAGALLVALIAHIPGS